MSTESLRNHLFKKIFKSKADYFFAALLVLMFLAFSVSALLGYRVGLELLMALLGITLSYIVAGLASAPRTTRPVVLTLLAVAWVSYFLVGILDASFGFLPGWLSPFFELFDSLAGNFGYGVVFGIGMVFFMRIIGGPRHETHERRRGG